MLSDVAVNKWKALAARTAVPGLTVGVPGDGSARTAIARLTRAAMAAGLGLAAAAR